MSFALLPVSTAWTSDADRAPAPVSELVDVTLIIKITASATNVIEIPSTILQAWPLGLPGWWSTANPVGAPQRTQNAKDAAISLLHRLQWITGLQTSFWGYDATTKIYNTGFNAT